MYVCVCVFVDIYVFILAANFTTFSLCWSVVICLSIWMLLTWWHVFFFSFICQGRET